jgi:uncharacterized protein (DUF2236 family)
MPVAGKPVPRTFQEFVLGPLVFTAGPANVLMQLSRLPVAYGVMKSRVHSGRLDRHPVKRTRTTLTYLVVADLGTEEERAWLREEINRQHRGVRSAPGDSVAYNAFDRGLQLWVAACIYLGYEELYRARFGEPEGEALEALYRHGARLADTLQVPTEMWPADRRAFEEYWQEGLRRIGSDEASRAFLHQLIDLRYLPRPLSLLLGPGMRFMSIGWLPQEFRDELRLDWGPRRERLFRGVVRGLAGALGALPRPLREFPFNVYYRDFQRRMRAGRAFT